MPIGLEIRLFGGLDIRRDGKPIGGFVSNKAPALLAYLVSTNRPHQRDALAALLWGEMADADARSNLRQALANLRKLVDPHLLISRETIAWNETEPYTLDVKQFLDHLQAGRDVPSVTRATAFRKATELYRGDFLAGFVVRDAPEFEEWQLAQRVRYRELALHALHTLTEHHLDRGEYSRAIDSATSLLAVDPWREDAYRQLMLALARSGQRAAALAQFEACRRILAKEIGVEPSAETIALQARIRAAGDTPPHNLPAQPTPFIGRDKELVYLAGQLQNPESRLLTLTGTGGMGKTRLALQVAERVHRQGLFLHGVFYVSLVGVDSLTGLAAAIAAACGFQFSGGREPADQLVAYLRDRETLLVLDNFEHLLPDSPWLADLLQQAPGVKLLVTSREPLNLRWERSLSVDSLAIPPLVVSSIDEISGYESARLFLARARDVQPDFTLTEAMVPDLAQICRLVAGMPLALELAAATTRYYTCAELAEAISHNLDLLATNLRDLPARHRSLRAVFESAWSLLPPPEQQLFAALSVFVGSFNQDAAEEIAGAGRALLAALVDKSLLYREEDGRYRMHNVLRQYAGQKPSVWRRQDLQLRYATYYTGWLHEQEAGLFSTHQAAIFEAIQTDLENLRAAWVWASENGRFDFLSRGLKTLGAFFNVQSRFLEGADWLEQTAKVLRAPAETGDPVILKLYAQVLTRWASFATWQGQNKRAETLFQEALSLAGALDDPEEMGFLLLKKGYLTMIAGDHQAAGQEFQESLARYRQAGEERGMADALSALGAWHNVTGDWTRARERLEESVAISRRIEDENGLRSSLTNLGNVHYYLGDYDQAKSFYEEALPYCRKTGDRTSEAILHCNLGALAEKSGDWTLAEEFLRHGMAMFEQANQPQNAIQASTMLAAVYRQKGQFDHAQQLLSQALSHAAREKYDYLVSIAVFEIGQLYGAMGQTLEALPLMWWVIEHPSSQAENRLEAEQNVKAWQEPLTAEQIAAIKTTTSEITARSILNRLTRKMATGEEQRIP